MTTREPLPCRVPDCPNAGAVSARQRFSVCWTHRGRRIRTGDYREAVPVRPVHSGDVAEWCSYVTAHNRVKNARGRACEHGCVDCGGSAEQWSYDGEAKQEFTGEHHGSTVRYSGDPDDYSPRCRGCHDAFDGKALTHG